ncbi:MAG: nicotinamide-nucleotide amidohydrolase family protein [Deltaproteobacteria bacterium]|nr:nicotinamide-nucleotide amidohydrolase family protein [Deltaproteobacteria bacterium]
MRIALLVTGSEILDGHVTDTNTGFLARELALIGIRLERAMSVRDSKNEIAAALTLLSRSADVVVASGGIGPTDDDVSMSAAAEAAGKPLRNRFPVGAERLKNTAGTADAALVNVGKARVFVFAGVPSEFEYSVRRHLIPRLAAKERGRVTDSLVLKTFGVREAKINELVGREIAKIGGLFISYLPVLPEIHLRLSATGTHYQNLVMLNRGEDIIREALGDAVWGVGAETLQQQMGCRLKAAGLKLAVAESCTGGMIADQITSVPGASEYFVSGVVTYSNDAKMTLLGVRRDTLLEHGAVSRQAVEEMAAGAMRISGAHVTAAVSGIAGPAGGTPGKPVGTVFLAVRICDLLRTESHTWNWGRDRFRKAVTGRVLWLIWKMAGDYAACRESIGEA